MPAPLLCTIMDIVMSSSCRLLLTTLFLLPVVAFAQAQPASIPPALQAESLGNATYHGLSGTPGRVTLKAGAWQGQSFMPSAATVPTVKLSDVPPAHGDLDGDRQRTPEAAVLIRQSGGGSGQFLHVAVVSAHRGKPRNLATRLVGDRIQVRDLRIEGGRVVLDVVRPGPKDASCCPGEAATLAWRLQRGRLVPVNSGVASTRLGPATLAGTDWVLRQWTASEAAAASPEITLNYQEGSVAGLSGCNRYNAAISAGPSPGDVVVSAPAGTRRACEGEAMSLEGRYLGLLAKVNRLGFRDGQLALDYGSGDQSGTLLFARRATTGTPGANR